MKLFKAICSSCGHPALTTAGDENPVCVSCKAPKKPLTKRS